MAEQFFRVSNLLALVGWVALVARPCDRRVSGWLCAWVLPAALAAAYVAILGWRIASGGAPAGDLSTIAGLRAAFSDDWVFAAAWTHYLVFDMVVGAGIARDACRLGIPWPVRTASLMLTFLFGPAGYLVHVVARSATAPGGTTSRPTG